MANRESRRKNKIKEEHKLIVNSNDEGMPSLIKITLVVAILFIVFYVVTLFITNNLKNNNSTNNNNSDISTPATIQYEEILAGETFNMNYNSYYVLFYNFKNDDASLYKNIVSNFKTAHSNLKIYTVDLSKGINDTYTNNISNPNVQRIDDLKINGSTLIKIENGINTSYIEGNIAIEEALK